MDTAVRGHCCSLPTTSPAPSALHRVEALICLSAELAVATPLLQLNCGGAWGAASAAGPLLCGRN